MHQTKPRRRVKTPLCMS